MKKPTYAERDRRSFGKSEPRMPRPDEDNVESTSEQRGAGPDPQRPHVAPSARLPERSEYARARRVPHWDE